MKKLIVKFSLLIIITLLFSCTQDNKQRENQDKATVLKSIQTEYTLSLFKTLPKDRFDLIFNEIIDLNSKGKIPLYKSDSLQETASLNDFITQFLGLALPDSNIEKASALTFVTRSIGGINIVEQITPSTNKLKLDYQLLAFAPFVRIDFGEGQYIRQPLFWIKLDDLKENLPPASYKTFINSIFVNLFNTEDYNMNPIERNINQRKIALNDFAGKFTMQEINETIYNDALSGKLTAYRNDSLASKYSTDEIKNLGSYEESVVIAPDPEYPYYVIDSVFVNYFRESDIVGNNISFKWSFKNEDHRFSKKLNAFGITYNLYAAEQYLGEQTLFWVYFKDLEKAIGKFRYQILIKAIMKENAQLHNYYKFQD